MSSGWIEFSNFLASGPFSDALQHQSPGVADHTRFHKLNNIISSSTRLDHIYGSVDIISHLSNTTVLPPFQSDHHMVTSVLTNPTPSSARPRWQKVKHSIAKNGHFIKAVESAIKDLPPLSSGVAANPVSDRWDQIKTTIVKQAYSQECRTKYHFRAELRKANRVLLHLKQRPPKHPSDGRYGAKLSEAEEAVSALLHRDTVALRQRVRVKWTEFGESNNKYYLNHFKHRTVKTTYDSVTLPGSNPIQSRDPDLVISTTYDFYSSLYSSVPTCPESIEEFFESIPEESLPPTISNKLIAPITLDEVKHAICHSPTIKSPGPDGIPFEVYKSISSLVAPVLLDLFNQTLTSNTSIPGGGLSYIILLFKKGDRGSLANWRPIALSNCDYKLLTKILTNRLMLVAPQLLTPFQHGFIHGRSIWDNIHHIQNVIQSPHSESAGALAFLDMEKAYDRVHWPFLFRAMKHFGLPGIFVDWIQKLYSSMASQVLGGKSLTNPFPVQQGLRQGDPILPLLFNFAINGFIVLLNQRLTGISVMGQAPTRCIAFADDCVVGFGDKSDPSAFRLVLSLYEKASNAKLNGSKTFSVAVGHSSFPFPYQLPFHTKPLDEPFRHLGVHFTSKGLATSHSEDKLLHGIRSRIGPWANRTASIAGKCVLINVYLLSKLWYLSHIIPFTENFFTQLESILQGWIWAPSRSHACKITSLYGPKTKGGLGLIDTRCQSRRILAKWMSAVFLPQSDGPHQDNWRVAAQIIFSGQAKIANQSDPLALSRWLAQKPYRNGPHSISVFWKLVLVAMKRLRWKVVFPCSSDNTVSNSLIPVLMGPDLELCLGSELPRRAKHVMATPELSQEIRPLPQIVSDKNVYKHSWSKLVIPRTQANTWRVLRRKYRIGLRQGPDSPHLACTSCHAPIDSHLHRFFLCPTVAPFWIMLKSSLRGRPPDPCDPPIHQDWFLLKSSLGIPSSIRILAFHIGLWVCHSSAVATFSGDPPLPPMAKLHSFRNQMSEHILRLLKYPSTNKKIRDQVIEWKSAWIPFLSFAGPDRSPVITWPVMPSNGADQPAPQNTPFSFNIHTISSSY
ncbi:reverse transcriptase [Thalictrum thalictroides]|uniref:Reverse transcriptase n=1 Tax=Thalictrum thalictroides TaxID=46969 RepID=A0A7J6VQ90_THATH|nr:reverse transcriptase [Thalictrum thalictroides]